MTPISVSHPGFRLTRTLGSTYTYSFEPNTEWSGFYSYSDEILQYFERFYKKYELAPYFRFNTEVVCATWLDETSECTCFPSPKTKPWESTATNRF
jgi:cation diffusion facilitator CzcD-associated flavoprotein CzcO